MTKTETRASYRARKKAFRAQLPQYLPHLAAINDELAENPDDPRGDDWAFVDALAANIREALANKAWLQRQSHATLERIGRMGTGYAQEVS
ncbi:hypothetical protein [Nocardiopsis sp. NRRL B-16309]|uniref:hypothetical protein n=1 Tax=Nocardiopsis sp. NRRL B-16309 TaxID=1519494 RepID=UPI0006B00BCF|nr:hypothetical protein [Nocardiopsis sp. NRRL B-16309]KOX10130.1 hypothetical protein ADL05_25965 [Nocardiopsis sp. NRRL B-16309]